MHGRRSRRRRRRRGPNTHLTDLFAIGDNGGSILAELNGRSASEEEREKERMWAVVAEMMNNTAMVTKVLATTAAVGAIAILLDLSLLAFFLLQLSMTTMTMAFYLMNADSSSAANS